jgi:hypothetical protein
MFFKFIKKSDQGSARVSPIIESNKEAGTRSYLDRMVRGEELPKVAAKSKIPSIVFETEAPRTRQNLNKLDDSNSEKTYDIRDYKVVLDPKEEERRSRLVKYATKCFLFEFLFSEWALNTTTHGITNVARLDNKLLKIVWLVCFLASTIYCIYTVVGIMVSFLEFNVLINQQVSFFSKM